MKTDRSCGTCFCWQSLLVPSPCHCYCSWVVNIAFPCFAKLSTHMLLVWHNPAYDSGLPIAASVNVLIKGTYTAWPMLSCQEFFSSIKYRVSEGHDKWNLYFFPRYKEGELHIGENSCIDRCVSKYWQVITWEVKIH